jgi:hypothetical protein
VITMSRISRLVVLMTSVAAVVAAMAGTASAVTWHVGGTGTFTATGGQATLSGTGNQVCPGLTVTGTYTAGSFAGATYSGVTGTATYQGCVFAGQSTEVTCSYVLTATAQPTITTTTTGTADVTCGVTLSNGVKICHIEGTVPGTYTNNASSADTVVRATSSSLRTTGAGCPIGSNDIVHISPTTLTLTSNGGNGPDIVRTA